MWSNDGLDGLNLLGGIATRVDFGGGHVGMSEPQRHFSNVLRCLQHNHCRGMPQHMWGYSLIQQSRALQSSRLGMLFEYVSKSPTAQGVAPIIDEHLRSRNRP